MPLLFLQEVVNDLDLHQILGAWALWAAERVEKGGPLRKPITSGGMTLLILVLR